METLVQKWIESLKSNKYKQGKFYLKNHDTYCATGVLGNIAKVKIDDATFLSDCNITDELRQILTCPVNDKGEVRFLEWYVIDMNDGGKSFPEIAQWLENYFFQWHLQDKDLQEQEVG